MRISEIIARLANIQTDFGDIHVEVRNEAGDADAVESVSLVNLKTSDAPVWRAFIDC